MNDQQSVDFARIAGAIRYLRDRFRERPSLEEVAGAVGLSAAHFQRMFTRWAGVSPKRFAQYLSVEYAKSLLSDPEARLFDVACDAGLSGTGRLHDLFVHIEAMTPAEYRDGGAALTIRYAFSPSPFGTVLTASTERGLCHMAFSDDPDRTFGELRALFPNAVYRQQTDEFQRHALTAFSVGEDSPHIRLHLKGTGFQIKVWEALLKIPAGRLATYGGIASRIGCEGGARAVGSAVGANPVSFLIPCHRVIRSSGALGGYHWGLDRKTAMIGWEAAWNDPLR